MGLPPNRKWFSLIVLAIIIPISLLATFKLTGIIPEPLAPESITVEPVMWEMDKPSDAISYWKRIENTYTDDIASMKVGVPSLHYKQDSSLPFAGRDGVSFDVYVNASVVKGFVVSVMVKFYVGSEAILFIHDGWLRRFVKESNVTITDARYNSIDSTEAYVEVKATTTVSSCNLCVTAHWVFTDENGNHELNVTSEILCFNGTSYCKIILPLQFKVISDVGNSFETAQPIMAGEYLRCLDELDFADIYSFNLYEGQTVTITMIPPQDANFDLYIYNPEMIHIANSTQSGNATESIAFTANSTGDWYIKVMRATWKGVYILKIEVLEG